MAEKPKVDDSLIKSKLCPIGQIRSREGIFFNFYICSLQMEETEKPTRSLLEGMTSNKRDKNALIGVGSL